jgi:EAL domain-containing protein (putative c-di-GMP-specific phosphodiesterase class I)
VARIAVRAQLLSKSHCRRWVKGDGCEEVQGFLLARPLPARRIADFIRSRLNVTEWSSAGPLPEPASVDRSR